MPPGDYTITITAGSAQQKVNFKVDPPAEGTATAPGIENLVMQPSTISPNSDAVDDVSQLTFRTNETSTLRVDLTSQSGANILAYPPVEKGPGEQSVVINGQDLAGNALADGTYTVTVQAEDTLGNRVQAQKPLTIQNSGQPSITVLKVEIAPQQVMIGSTIAVSVTVMNNGKVPLRTQGPDPGYTYTDERQLLLHRGRQVGQQSGPVARGGRLGRQCRGRAFALSLPLGTEARGSRFDAGRNSCNRGKITIPQARAHYVVLCRCAARGRAHLS